MGDAWDDDSFEPPPVKTGVFSDKWDGEDDDVKDAWDADESENEERDSEVKVVPKKKTLEEKIREREEKARKDKILRKELERELTENEKRQMQEESDLLIAKETLGINLTPTSGLDAYNPKTLEEWKEFRFALQDKIIDLRDSPFYAVFVESFVRELAVPLDSECTKTLGSTLHTMAAEKLKKEKELAGKKKKKKGGHQLNRGVGGYDDGTVDYDDGFLGDEYDDFM